MPVDTVLGHGGQRDVQRAPAMIRPLGWPERLFWLLDQNRPRHFVMAAHVVGRTRPGQWRQALDAVQGRHPLLSAGIKVGEGSVPCFYSTANAPIPLRVLEGGAVAQEWQYEFARELGLPFDREKVPLMRAVLLHERERAICILSAHHSIADGMSIALVFRDLLQAVSGAALRPLTLLPAFDDLVTRAASGSRRQSTVKGLDSIAPGRPARYRDRDGAVPEIRTMQLASGVVNRLRERAREEWTTVHGALCTGLALSFAQAFGKPANEPVRIWSPVDVRKLLGLGDECALLATSIVVPVECNGSPWFWDAARGVAAKLSATRSIGYLDWGLSLLSQSISGLDVAAAAQLMAHRFAFDFVVTNLGVLPYGTRFGDLSLQALWGPAVLSGFENEHVFGIATTGENLALTYSSYTPSDTLLGLLEHNLLAACEPDG